jgi:UDP-N-acetylmuramoyl-tripeptide--D-alanyl-D-alanine ligase
MQLTAHQIAQWVGVDPATIGADINFSGVAIDSRGITPGELYVALPGERFDGHEFVRAAASRGAAAALVSREIPEAGLPLIQVPPERAGERAACLTALQDLSAGWRRQFSLPLIAVTGSVGKTTTKDILAHLLAARYRVLKTAGNHNNEIGLPLTLLGLNEQHTAAVVEMGMRAPGEIAELCRISAPGYGIITNVGPVHLETLGSMEAIAAAKTELLGAIPPEGFSLLPGENEFLRAAAARYDGTRYYFGSGADCALRLEQTRLTPEGIEFTAAVFGESWSAFFPAPAPRLVLNALAAVGMAYRLGVSLDEIRAALATFAGGASRLEMRDLPEGGLLINDTYNANPLSMQNALEVLAAVSAGRPRVAVLGDMYELGGYTREGHRLVGQKAADTDLEALVTVGEFSADLAAAAAAAGMPQARIHHFAAAADCGAWLRQNIARDHAVLFKASRGMRLEQILSVWVEENES